MPGDNGQPAMRSAGPDEERVSTAALLAAMELIRGMSDNPAATPPDQLMDDIQRAQIRPEADRRAAGHPPGVFASVCPDFELVKLDGEDDHVHAMFRRTCTDREAGPVGQGSSRS
jgi:hypothetical protein